MTRRLVFAAAVLVLAAASYAQATAYHTLTPTPAATTTPTTLPDGCDGLRLEYSRRHSTWKATVKFGRESAAELAAMRAILRAVGRLERRGVCGG
jgi:hypothetical protein